MTTNGAQFSGFKPFYQFACPTRVIAGVDLIESTGFEFAKEGAERPMIVTDAVIRETGRLVEGAMGDGCTLVNAREPTEKAFEELYRNAL